MLPHTAAAVVDDVVGVLDVDVVVVVGRGGCGLVVVEVVVSSDTGRRRGRR